MRGGKREAGEEGRKKTKADRREERRGGEREREGYRPASLYNIFKDTFFPSYLAGFKGESESLK